MHGGISVSLDYEWAGFNELYTCVFTVFCIVCNSIISHFLVILMNANNKGGRGRVCGMQINWLLSVTIATQGTLQAITTGTGAE